MMPMGPNRQRILVVDDLDDNVFTLQRRLAQFVDAELASASNGRVALAQIEAQRTDLVLLDVQMPEMDGLEVLGTMKADMSMRNIPVIMVSAVDDFDTVLRCIRLGADDYVQKPFNADLLRVRVEAALERKRLRDQEELFVQQIQAEKAFVNQLLHSILPASIVSDMRSGERPHPKRCDNVAVLFCDIVGFTEYCDRNSPEQVVSELETLVALFETIVETHGLEKIKTIGDAFLATANLLDYVENPAANAARCGLAMVEAARGHSPGWHVRVGVHVGPVVAGLMGRRSFVFDIWGDTVNTASRVAAEAAPDEVLVTGSMWPYLDSFCTGRRRGLVELRGKGRVELVACTGTTR
jgi:class 3 adenylate cyclase/CheY-like chemotaxis protein